MRRRRINHNGFADFIVLSAFLFAMYCSASGQQSVSATNLIQQFKAKQFFWQQFEVAEKIVKLHDTTVLGQLELFLNDEDRHERGNAAFVFAALGDDRGFEVIRAILEDRTSARPKGDIPAGNCTLSAQIRSDRYYAVWLFGNLKDARAVSILIPLLKDENVNWGVPWALGEIGDKSAVSPLIQTLSERSPDMRVLSIYALVQLGAKEALPQLHLMVHDEEKIHFDGLGTVAEAARSAIAKLDAMT